jgi:hypothetical protein
MAFDINQIGGFIFAYIFNPLMWLIIIIGILVVTFGFLKLRRMRAMKFPAVEFVDLGNGKMGMNLLKCGWIGIKLQLKGWWWSGREVMRTDAMEIVQLFSEEDFQEVNGKRGVVFYRDPVSRTLLPISQLKVKNKELALAIPDGDYVDNAISIVRDAEKETSDRMAQLIQWAIMGGIIIFALVSIIIIVQMVTKSQDKASELILSAGKTCLESAKAVCSEIASTVGKTAGGTAP